MSRVAKLPIFIPNDIEIKINKQLVLIKSKNEELKYNLHKSVKIVYNNNILSFSTNLGYDNFWSHVGTARSIINSMIVGIKVNFEKKLFLSGVGYKVSLSNKNSLLTMSLGYSHSINYELPNGVFANVPSQTEIVLKSSNKQLLGQVAANLRSYRIPESYKGKGIRYSDEFIRIKEAKKK
ncbi:50S ribosomal protein L6 [Buchnera aphidicola (Neophyllaphis podocarpi)]|uniref:50S ribosomal protein L6 n=1 Tax=Buchnera aphidicola TaxID=9 RepID=UPI0031B82264